MRAYYDLKFAPPTYDFFAFLMSADLFRKHRGVGTMEVAIVPGPDNGFRRDDLPPRDPAWRRKMLQEIVIEGAWLCPSVTKVSEIGREEAINNIVSDRFPEQWNGQGSSYYGLNRTIQALKDPEFEGLKARDVIELAPKTVMITLRESHYWLARNSNLKEWVRLGWWLKANGWNPIFIRDAEKTGEIVPFVTRCGIGIRERMALYEAAALNFFVVNGPAGLAFFSKKVPYIVCMKAVDDAPCANNHFWAGQGLMPGSDFPNAGKMQRLLWGHDEFEAMKNLFSEMMASV